MTKALFITHTAAPSGAELATLRLAVALRDTGQMTPGVGGESLSRWCVRRTVRLSIACAKQVWKPSSFETLSTVAP